MNSFFKPFRSGVKTDLESRSILTINSSLPVSSKDDTPKRFAFLTAKELHDLLVALLVTLLTFT